MDLSVVIPVYNEEGNIPELYQRLRAVMEQIGGSYELLFVNDGSRDSSLALIRELAAAHPEVRYIDFSRNFGHQIAVSAGLDRARGEAIVVIDADLQDPPEVIPDLYRRLREGYEVVYARRRRRDGERWYKLAAIRIFYRLLARITSIDIPIDTGDFRIIDRRVAEVLRQMPERHKYIRGQIAWIGFRQTAVVYDRAPRFAGTTGYSLKKLIGLALDGITGFSDLPLKMVTYFGFIVSFIAFVVTIFALYSRLFLQDVVPGWASLMISVLFIGGIQMIAIGIIGEYLSRINTDVRGRPLYIVRESNLDEPSPSRPAKETAGKKA